MSDGDRWAGGVIDREDAEVLVEGSAAPGVDGLEAKADAEDGFAVRLGIFEKEDVGGFAGGIGGSGGRVCGLAVAGGVDVGGGSGEEDAVAGIDEGLEIGGGGSEGELDGSATGLLDGGEIGGEVAAVVVEVGGGGSGDGDTGLHLPDDTGQVNSAEGRTEDLALRVNAGLRLAQNRGRSGWTNVTGEGRCGRDRSW